MKRTRMLQESIAKNQIDCAFNRSIIEKLEKRIWDIENPVKFKRGEIAETRSLHYPTLEKVEILDWKERGFSRVCQVRIVNGEPGKVVEIHEYLLQKIVKTVPAKS